MPAWRSIRKRQIGARLDSGAAPVYSSKAMPRGLLGAARNLAGVQSAGVKVDRRGNEETMKSSALVSVQEDSAHGRRLSEELKEKISTLETKC